MKCGLGTSSMPLGENIVFLLDESQLVSESILED